ncbi:MAG: sulfatase [Bacteroidota bacterium]
MYKNIFSLLVAVALIFQFIGCNSSEAKLIPHPNVLFVALDDMNDWASPLAGNGQALTPNLDAFAKESVNFTKNYCTSPGCNPSRSTLLTGLHTYNSGMYSNYQDWRKVPLLKGRPTLSHYFRQNGYFTAGAGKIFHYSQVDTLAWNEYYPSIKQPMPKEFIPENAPLNMEPFKYMYNMFDWADLDISDEETADFKSVQYISQQLAKNHEKPFFLACGIYRPHLPWYVPKKYFDLFPLDKIQLPKTVENDTADLGPRAKELIRRGGNYHKYVIKNNQWKNAVQGYLASIAYADAMLGHLLNNLKKSPYAENTIVVIWSDHGWQLGEKMHWRKFALWENVTRTVMMIKVPAGLAALPDGAAKNKSTASLTSLLDIYPTLVELCQLPERIDLDGHSLTPLLKNPEQNIARPIITTYDYGDYSIRHENWHLIKYIDGSEELYNLTNDPEEWYNLANADSLTEIKNKLIAFIPKKRVDLPEESLIELMEHHIPPVKSEAFYFSEGRKEWMKRFDNN